MELHFETSHLEPSTFISLMNFPLKEIPGDYFINLSVHLFIEKFAVNGMYFHLVINGKNEKESHFIQTGKTYIYERNNIRYFISLIPSHPHCQRDVDDLKRWGELGSGDAYYELGIAHECGEAGLKKDMEEAAIYMKLASDLGLVSATEWLKDYYYDDDAGVQSQS